jgi:hypothetical protein
VAAPGRAHRLTAAPRQPGPVPKPGRGAPARAG